MAKGRFPAEFVEKAKICWLIERLSRIKAILQQDLLARLSYGGWEGAAAGTAPSHFPLLVPMWGAGEPAKPVKESAEEGEFIGN